MSGIDPVEVSVSVFFEKPNAMPSMVSDTDTRDRDFLASFY